MLENKPLGNRGATENDLEKNELKLMVDDFEIERPEINQFPKKLNKKIIKNLESSFLAAPSEKTGRVSDVNDDDLKKIESDLLMKEWIAEFTAEIDEIDKFYTEKFETYAQEFIDMQGKFLSKMALDEELR